MYINENNIVNSTAEIESISQHPFFQRVKFVYRFSIYPRPYDKNNCSGGCTASPITYSCHFVDDLTVRIYFDFSFSPFCVCVCYCLFHIIRMTSGLPIFVVLPQKHKCVCVCVCLYATGIEFGVIYTHKIARREKKMSILWKQMTL